MGRERWEEWAEWCEHRVGAEVIWAQGEGRSGHRVGEEWEQEWR